MLPGRKHRRPLVLGLAAAILSAGAVFAQGTPLAERVRTCSACHGEDGNSKLENMPSLAGQPAFFILNQMILMRENVRRVEAMAPFVKDLKDEEIAALAEHFAKLPPKPSGETIDPALVAQGTDLAAKKVCVSCHTPTLGGQQQVPRIAKQRVDYLIRSMKEFRDGTRPGGDTAMSANVAGLSDADLVALGHYSASR